MSGLVTVTPGIVFDESGNGEWVTLPKLNALGNPSARIGENQVTERELATSITDEIGALRTDLSTETSSRITEDAALLAWQQTVEASYGANLVNVGVTLSAHADSLGNLDTYWGVALNANGAVIGRIRLDGSVDADSGTVLSNFDVVADNFRVVAPDGTVGNATFSVDTNTNKVMVTNLQITGDLVNLGQFILDEDGFIWGDLAGDYAQLFTTGLFPALTFGNGGVENARIGSGGTIGILSLQDGTFGGPFIQAAGNGTIWLKNDGFGTPLVMQLDNDNYIQIDADAKIQFSGGGILADTNLYRGGVGLLQTDDDLAAGGRLRARVRVNTYTGTSQTAALVDRSAIVEMDNAAANTLSLPLESATAFAVGDSFDVVNQGAGTTTVQGVAGVTVNGTDGGGVTVAAGQAVSVYKRGADEWRVIGGTDV